MNKPVIGITMGDPGGIGPEIIVKALRSLKPFGRFCYVVFGVPKVFESLKKNLGIALPYQRIPAFSRAVLDPTKINFFDTSESSGETFDVGKVSLVNAAMTYQALSRAAEFALKGEIDAIATAPLNKEALRLLDPKFRGHTEFLAEAAGVPEYAMFFVSPKLKVTLATLHVPIRRVSEILTAELIESKICLTSTFLKKYFGIARPKIAVCALNPHGRETGEEEDRVIAPAIAKTAGLPAEVKGPFPADQLFYSAYRGKYDAVICMYHDQGLGPFKMMAFHDGVNVTIGLPFIRTSPDHGTAFDIAWSGKADPASMLACLKLAGKFLLTARKNC